MQVDVLTFNLGITIRGLKAQQQKLSAPPVKQEVAGVQSVRNATKARFKTLQGRPRAVNVQTVLPTTPMDRPGAMPFLLDRTSLVVLLKSVIPVTTVKEEMHHKRRAKRESTPPAQNPYHVLTAHLENSQITTVPSIAMSVGQVTSAKGEMHHKRRAI